MDTSKLKKFSQYARRSLMEQVSVKLRLVLAEGSTARRESTEAVGKLEEQIGIHCKEHVIEKVAYTWFNRFCALRFMDVNHYTGIGIISPAEGQTQPELLAEAKMGHMDQEMVPEPRRKRILDLLRGSIPSQDPQSEAYQLLIVAACNQWHRTMPFLFQRIDDFTELLMPTDLLSPNSILASIRDTMTLDVCRDVEVIGWLYQFYISEKKDEVFKALKKNKKITPENIPAATQLFTPHWIVQFLVQNSLGRLWMLNRPNSTLAEKMEYYIKPEQPETDFLRISKPEEIRVCDPACGSGHMLTYTFDLLHAIYEEEGYEPSEIPEKILTHNLYGIEIDDRAGELAAFALTMKARAKQSRFFGKRIQPNICVLESISIGHIELKDYMDHLGRDLFTFPLIETLQQFEEANNFGSLIRPRLTAVDEMLRILEAKNVSRQLFLVETHKKVLQALKQADYLSPKYHVVVANPPYMGGKGMNARLGTWVKENYPSSKSDLFASFIERGLEMIPKHGYSAMVTMQSWMFLSSFEAFRSKLMAHASIEVLAHMANMVMGIAFGTSAAVWKMGGTGRAKGSYCYVEYEDIGECNKPKVFPPRNEKNAKALTSEYLYYSSVEDFKMIPGSPIAFWVSDRIKSIFAQALPLTNFGSPIRTLQTGNRDEYIRQWSEISIGNFTSDVSSVEQSISAPQKWYGFHNGGPFRKWYGNNDYAVNWKSNGYDIKRSGRAIIPNEDKYFSSFVTWSRVSSYKPSFRYQPIGVIPGDIGPCIVSEKNLLPILGLLNTNCADYFGHILNPSMVLQTGDLCKIPAVHIDGADLKVIKVLVKLGKNDWDSFENSWDFTTLPLLHPAYREATLPASYRKLRSHWLEMTLEMKRLEEENNRIFIEAYGLQDELTPDVPLNEITLTCNPHYRYSGKKSEAEHEALLLADTLKEFISYAVGCMFGRYALEKPGLVLANQGETFDDYLQQIPNPVFSADDNNVIPILDGDWFTDDITERFLRFLKITFGDECYEENLSFIEKAIGKDIRKYFLRDFYSEHVRRYKNRPIYWLFSSPRGSFNALIYMHRYRPDTVSVVLNDYLREFRAKLSSRLEHLGRVEASVDAAREEKTRALKEIQELTKVIHELDTYERDVLYPLATKKIEIDLDDGVKVNYPKFGTAVRKITGLDAKEEEDDG